MGFSANTKKELFSKLYPGVGSERIAERTQGCWNCVHWDVDKAAKLWWDEARTKQLNRAVEIAVNSPKGEADHRVFSIRQQVPQLDALFTLGKFGCCSRGIKPDNTPVDDFVFDSYLCTKWTAKQGASVAREGQAADKLPEELMADLHDPKKTTI